MKLNADFSQRVVVHADEVEWQRSPMAGVDCRPLDRIGGEVARATTIVRYAPQSHFSPHVHGGGEEFLVLDSVFEDEHGAFAAGSYIRNPPTSRHTPGSEPGCTILVKLWQMHPDDRTEVRLDTAKLARVAVAERPGIATVPLFDDGRECVRIEDWPPDTKGLIAADGGGELFVLEGSASEAGTALRLWIKTGHLRDVRAPSGS